MTAAQKLPQESQDSPQTSITDIMKDIRARVADRLAAGTIAQRAMPRAEPQFNKAGAPRGGELAQSEELRYLNIHHAYGLQSRSSIDEISSHRPGLLGRCIVKVKRKVLSMIWEGLLRPYLEQERDFQSNLVRHLNASGRYIDDRDASNFWELIHKIDYDINKTVERCERGLDTVNGSLIAQEKRSNELINQSQKALSQEFGQVLAKLGELSAKATALESVTQGLESLAAKGHIGSNAASVLTPAQNLPDPSYVLLENRFRGSIRDIRSRLSIYPTLFSDNKKVVGDAPILEIGAGRGELQLLFREAGVASRGVDTDAAMAAEAANVGVAVEVVDGLQVLRDAAPGSLGGVIAIQVVEHLPVEIFKELLALSSSRVKPGGLIIFETINPKSLLALSSNYFRDPTHVAPVHPDTLAFWMSLTGIEHVETRYLSPVPQEAKLKPLPTFVSMTPRWESLIEVWNHNLNILNGLLFGDQDYCVIGKAKGE